MNRTLPALLAALLLAPLLPGAVAAKDAPLGDSPHGRPDRCDACHQAGPTPEQPGLPLPIVETCRSCHPTADMHPVGMAPAAVHVPEGWPLEGGRVTCATCHAEPAHTPSAAAVAPWHRSGPYAQRTDLCYQCHVREDYVRTDPHRAARPRDPADPSCAACHTGIPATGAPVAEARLRFATDEACATCHPGPAHAGAAEHLGRHVTEPNPSLTLLDGAVIACFTCHEVHDGAPSHPPTEVALALRTRALARDWSALPATGLRWPGDDDGHNAMLSMPGDALCTNCH